MEFETEKIVWLCAAAVAITLLCTVSSCVQRVSNMQKECIAGAKTDAQAMLCLRIGG